MISSLNVFGQWTELSSGTSETLNCVYFTDENTGYVGGAGATTATLIKTTDAGISWNSLTISTVNEITSISFPTSSIGYLITKQSELFKTTNSGDSWENIYNFGVFDGTLCFINENIGFIANGDGTIYKTTDGGLIWESIFLDDFSNPTAIFFPNSEVGYVSTYWGKIAKTTDMGLSWTILTQPTSKPLWDLFFTNTNTGYAVGGDGVSSLIIKTTDGGSSWLTQTTTPITTQNHNAVFFSDIETGYLGNSTIYKTNTSGDTWYEMSNSGQILDLYFPSSTIGYATGYNGVILKLDLTLGINDIINNNKIIIYPNPAKKFVFIETLEQIEKIILTNQIGQIINIEKNKNILNVQNLKKGIYYITFINNNGEKIIKKLIKN
jgi:photosystem II stability/assembly factor-like uncharacterized protein